MKCPVCHAVYRPARAKLFQSSSQATGELKSPASPKVCRRCGADLSSLIRLRDQAVWYYQQALQSWRNGDYSQARVWNEQALALHQNHADFQALAGQLSALEGEFQQAIVSWQKALRLVPQHPLAYGGLQILTELLHSN
jgi:tetratricopeptide (TPR) repeat protein